MPTANIKNLSSHICAFCVYWNDRQDTHIKHKYFDMWEYDNHASEYCSVKRINRPSFGRCNKFEMKL